MADLVAVHGREVVFVHLDRGVMEVWEVLPSEPT